MVGLFGVKEVLLKLFFSRIILALEVVFELDVLKGLIDFLAEGMENLGFRLAVLVKFVENSAVLGFFDLVTVNR